MAEVSALIEGGKATAGAPLGPALGPLGVNIGEIVAKINEKTKGYSGMKVPVTIEVHKNKSYDILVGSPPTSAIITKEVKAQKGGANQKTDVIGNLSMEQVKKLAEMKIDSLTSTSLISAAREIIGTCNSMGVSIEGKHAKIIQQEFKEGKWDSFFGAGEKKETKVPAINVGEELSKIAKKAEVAAENMIKKAIEMEEKIVGGEEKEPAKEEVIIENVEDNVNEEIVKEEKKEEPKKVVKEAEVKEEPKKKPGESQNKVLQKPVQEKASKESKSYSQHMAGIEKELGISKEEKKESVKKVETEITSTPNSEIIRPKKKQE
jgi:large subunit ribosomal protein L11